MLSMFAEPSWCLGPSSVSQVGTVNRFILIHVFVNQLLSPKACD